MANKVTDYLKNLTMSVVYYGTEDYVNDVAPVTYNTIKGSIELGREVIDSVRNYKALLNRMTNTDSFKIAETGLNNAISDIKSGKLYNKEREDEAYDKSMGDSFDDFDWNFDEETTKSTTDNEPSIEEESTKILKGSIEQSSKASSATISTTILNSAKYNGGIMKQAANMLYLQNTKLLGDVKNSIFGVNNTLVQMAKFNENILKTHAENARTFYTESTKLQKENNAILKEMLEMQRIDFKEREENRKQMAKARNAKVKGGLSDLLRADGDVDLEEYGKAVKKNFINEMYSLGVGSVFGLNKDIFEKIAASPLKGISGLLITKLIGAPLEKSIKSFEKTLASLPAKILSDLAQEGKEDYFGIKAIIGRIFGVDTNRKRTIDTGAYHKGPVPFDGVTRKAITEVIPNYLRRILGALGGEEQIFDYNNGKWTNIRDIRKDFDKRKDNISRYAMSSYSSRIESAVKKSNFSKNQKADIDAAVKKAFDYMVTHNGRVPNFDDFTGDKGLDGYLNALFQHLDLRGASNEIVDAIRNFNSYITAEQNVEYSVLNNLFDKSIHGRGSVLGNKLDSLDASVKSSARPGGKLKRIKRRKGKKFTQPIAPVEVKSRDEEATEILNSDSYEDAIRDLNSGKINVDKSFDTDNPVYNAFKGIAEKEGFLNKLNFVWENISTVIKSPRQAIAAGILSADKAIYNFFFKHNTGLKDENGKDVKGLFDRVVLEMKTKFNEFSKWMKEKLFNPLKEKLKKGWKFAKSKAKDLWDKAGGEEIWQNVKTSGVNFLNRGFDFGRSLFGHAAGTTYVPETGLTTISKGEMIIPSYMNPFNPDRDKSNFSKDKRAELDVKKKFIDSMIGMNAGGTASVEFDEGMSKLKGNISATKADVLSMANKIKADVYKTINDKFSEATGDASNLANKIIGATAGDKVKNIKDDIRTMTADRPKFIGQTIFSSGLGALAGAILGPGAMLGALGGAAVNVVRQSKTFQEILFGEETLEGRSGGIITKRQQELFHKYFPDFAKYGISGGLLSGLLLGTGPVGAAVIGSAMTMAKHHKGFNEFLFGREYTDEKGKTHNLDNGLISKKLRDHIKKAFPRMSAATLAMMFAPLPVNLGLTGSIILGSGIGLVSSTDSFKKLLLGEEDLEGNRHGGILGAMKDYFVNPLKDFGEWVTNFFTRTLSKYVLTPLKDFFRPMRSLSKHFFKFIGSAIMSGVHKVADATIAPYLRLAGEKLSPIGRFGKKVAKGALNKLGYMAFGIPATILGGLGSLGNKGTKELMSRGLIDTMDARERLQFAKEHGNYDYGDYKTLDERLEGMSSEEIKQLNDMMFSMVSTKKLKHKEAQFRNDLLNNELNHAKFTAHGVSKSDILKIGKIIMRGDKNSVDDVAKYIDKNLPGIPGNVREELLNVAKKKAAEVYGIRRNSTISEEEKAKAFDTLNNSDLFKDLGISLNSDNIDKFSDLFERENKSREFRKAAGTPEMALNMEQVSIGNEQLKSLKTIEMALIDLVYNRGENSLAGDKLYNVRSQMYNSRAAELAKEFQSKYEAGVNKRISNVDKIKWVGRKEGASLGQESVENFVLNSGDKEIEALLNDNLFENNNLDINLDNLRKISKRHSNSNDRDEEMAKFFKRYLELAKHYSGNDPSPYFKDITDITRLDNIDFSKITYFSKTSLKGKRKFKFNASNLLDYVDLYNKLDKQNLIGIASSLISSCENNDIIKLTPKKLYSAIDNFINSNMKNPYSFEQWVYMEAHNQRPDDKLKTKEGIKGKINVLTSANESEEENAKSIREKLDEVNADIFSAENTIKTASTADNISTEDRLSAINDATNKLKDAKNEQRKLERELKSIEARVDSNSDNIASLENLKAEGGNNGEKLFANGKKKIVDGVEYYKTTDGGWEKSDNSDNADKAEEDKEKKGFFSKLGDKITSVGDKFKSAMNIGKTAKEKTSAFVDKAKSIFDTIKTFALGAVGAGLFAKYVYPVIKPYVKEIMSKTAEIIGEIAKDVVPDLIGAIYDMVVDMIKGSFEMAWDAIKGTKKEPGSDKEVEMSWGERLTRSIPALLVGGAGLWVGSKVYKGAKAIYKGGKALYKGGKKLFEMSKAGYNWAKNIGKGKAAVKVGEKVATAAPEAVEVIQKIEAAGDGKIAKAITWVKGILNKLLMFISEHIPSIGKNLKVSNIPKVVNSIVSRIVSNKKAITKIAARLGPVLAGPVGVAAVAVINVAMFMSDLYEGIERWFNVAGVLSTETVPEGVKQICGIAAAIDSALFNIIGADNIASTLFWLFNIDISEQQSKALAEVEKYNNDNSQDKDPKHVDSVKEYNDKVLDVTTFTKITTAFSNAWDYFTGGDKNTQDQLYANRQVPTTTGNKLYPKIPGGNTSPTTTKPSRSKGRMTLGAAQEQYHFATGKYFKQNDPRYANLQFNTSQDDIYQTIGDSACGPIAGANAIQALGTGVDPIDASRFALQKGFKGRNTGTDPRFFNSYANKYGTEAETLSKGSILERLSSGQPVVLDGEDSSGAKPGKHPFGTYPHYVTATGYDNRRNEVIIQDPESRFDNLRYPASHVVGKTRHAYGFKPKGTGMSSMLPIAMHYGLGKRYPRATVDASDVMKRVFKQLKKNGLTDVAAAGIMGNIMQESTFNPAASNGDHFGLFQWDTSRWERKSNNGFGDSPEDQVDYAIWEMKNGEFFDGSGKYTIGDLNRCNTPEEAASLFERGFERSGGDALANRQKYAISMFETVVKGKPYKELEGVSYSGSISNTVGGIMSGGGLIGKVLGKVFKPLTDRYNEIFGGITGGGGISSGGASGGTFNGTVASADSVGQWEVNALKAGDPGAEVTSPFSLNRTHPVTGAPRPHKGVDIGAAAGTDVIAPASGKIQVPGFDDGGYGNWVRLLSDKGTEYRFGHLSSISVSDGQEVTGGKSIIGQVGSTGASTGPHLHFEARPGASSFDDQPDAVDPMTFAMEKIVGTTANSGLPGAQEEPPNDTPVVSTNTTSRHKGRMTLGEAEKLFNYAKGSGRTSSYDPIEYRPSSITARRNAKGGPAGRDDEIVELLTSINSYIQMIAMNTSVLSEEDAETGELKLRKQGINKQEVLSTLRENNKEIFNAVGGMIGAAKLKADDLETKLPTSMLNISRDLRALAAR